MNQKINDPGPINGFRLREKKRGKKKNKLFARETCAPNHD